MSREWQADRQAVFERDDYTCLHCEATGETDSRTYPIGSVPLTPEETVHESHLATVCTDCFGILRGEQTIEVAPSRRDLFETIRAITQTQGGAIADGAAFASLATSLPSHVVDGETPPYGTHRRDLRLALEMAQTRLDSLETVDATAFDADIRERLESFSAVASALQSQLDELVTVVETVAAGLNCCHVCFALLDPDAVVCETCHADRLENDDWSTDAGDPEFDALFAALNDALKNTSETTEGLTQQAAVLAEALLEVE